MFPLGLSSLGWDAWFEAQAKNACDKNAVAVRVAAVDRDQLAVLGSSGAFRAKLSGKFIHEAASPSDRPCVGDWLCIERGAQDEFGIVHNILQRKSFLRRKTPGSGIEFQMIAANVDFVVIVQSCHYDFNVKRLERYLVMVRDGGATPYILLTKTDLVSPDVVADQIHQIRSAGIDVDIISISNVTANGIQELLGILVSGKTYCFVGSSGVGKSTLINRLIGHDVIDTKTVSGTGEGRHTTVRRELILLENGAMVIDNPGMREFGIIGAEAGIDESFSDIQRISTNCYFRDCSHTTEPNCAVLKAVELGEIHVEHYNNYVKLRRESEFHQLSYVEKRRKDRAFGRFIKSAKKDMDDD